jgi:hypothetical protein
VGPHQLASQSASEQGDLRLGTRRCLLKGCECSYTPHHPLSQYCSPECQAAARRWRQQQANRRYRASTQGKCRRREQSCRYRQRQRIKRAPETMPCAGGEGYQERVSGDMFCCQRPGCYVHFVRTPRSPLQRFCSFACRQALRRVRLRERRWRRILGWIYPRRGMFRRTDDGTAYRVTHIGHCYDTAYSHAHERIPRGRVPETGAREEA